MYSTLILNILLESYHISTFWVGSKSKYTFNSLLCIVMYYHISTLVTWFVDMWHSTIPNHVTFYLHLLYEWHVLLATINFHRLACLLKIIDWIKFRAVTTYGAISSNIIDTVLQMKEKLRFSHMNLIRLINS